MATDAATQQRLIAFMPWTTFARTAAVGAIEFVPFRVAEGPVTPELRDLEAALKKVLASYVTITGDAIDNCVVVCHARRSPRWNLTGEDAEEVGWAAAAVTLAALSANQYYTSIGSYTNTSSLELLWQRFIEPAEWIALSARRRDGSTLDGGYRHGEVRFTRPIQCRTAETIDLSLLNALVAAEQANSPSMSQIRAALPFFLLACTDAPAVSAEAEIILMASAFEKLLKGDGSAYKLSRRFAAHLRPYGAVTVGDALTARPAIRLDHDPAREAAQRDWHVHQKWIEELYDRRSKHVHAKSPTGAWGWTDPEHLIAGAFVFPLIVKLILSTHGFATLGTDDLASCRAFDKLLSATEWGKVVGTNSNATRWRQLVNEERSEVLLDRAVRHAVEGISET